jgi:hypothetical protein
MATRFKEVEWLDETVGALDLESCEERTSTRDDPMRPHLYRTPEGRFVLELNCAYFELSGISAARCILGWGLAPPLELALLLKEHERAQSSPSQRLPLPPVTSTENAVILFGPLDSPIVLGKPKRPLGPIRHTVIKTLIDAGDEGLSMVELRNRSGLGGARGVLERIRDGDDDWRSVIWFPGRSRLGHYRIVHPDRRQSA